MSEIKTEFKKFEAYLKTLEFKFFGGKLHQKVVAPNPGQTPDHVWVPVEAHDGDAPAPGEAIVTATSTSTATSTMTGGTAPEPPTLTVETSTSTSTATHTA